MPASSRIMWRRLPGWVRSWDEPLAVAGEVAQFQDRHRGYEAGVAEAAFEELAIQA
jgi:hypothetical protein